MKHGFKDKWQHRDGLIRRAMHADKLDQEIRIQALGALIRVSSVLIRGHKNSEFKYSTDNHFANGAMEQLLRVFVDLTFAYPCFIRPARSSFAQRCGRGVNLWPKKRGLLVRKLNFVLKV